MLICVSVYHNACLGYSHSAVMWQPQSVFLKRTKLTDWMSTDLFFSALSCTALWGSWNVNKFVNELVFALITPVGHRSYTWTHLNPLCDFFFSRRSREWTQKGRQMRSRHAARLCLSPFCVSSLWNREWQRSDASCGFYLDAQPENAFSVWHCAVAVSQSVCPSVIQNQRG